jgi:uncharacterized protein YuzE
MKFNYYAETDSLYIELSVKESTDSKEIAEGIIIDFDTDGKVVGIDIDHASKIVDLSKLESKSLPLKQLEVV